MGKPNYRLTLVLVAGLVVFAGCDNPTGSKDASSDEDTPGSSEWTWMSGNSIANLSGSYGATGAAYPSNRPGARDGAVSWRDDGGDLWLFGGEGYDSGGSERVLNDLWRFDGTAWTWVSGSATGGEAGSYGTKSVPDGANVPGARSNAVSWRDDGGDLWLFGGVGLDGSGTGGVLNDLWRFDGTAWTWVSGSATEDEAGSYGTKNVADGANVPGARSIAVSWGDDGGGDVWLFGGGGYDGSGTFGRLNDLWRLEP